MEKKLFWESNEKDYFSGRYEGVLLDPDEIEQSVYCDDLYCLIWSDKKVIDAPEIPTGKIEFDGEEYESLSDLYHTDRDAFKNYLDELVGSESLLGREWEPVDDGLCWEDTNMDFGSTDEWETTYTYTYICDGNRKTIYLGEEETEYELEMLDSYTLDILDYNTANRTYGGVGNHAILHKVVVDGDTKDVRLLWHEWSQWSGNELDTGYFVTISEALEALERHPEIEEIRAWLEA